MCPNPGCRVDFRWLDPVEIYGARKSWIHHFSLNIFLFSSIKKALSPPHHLWNCACFKFCGFIQPKGFWLLVWCSPCAPLKLPYALSFFERIYKKSSDWPSSLLKRLMRHIAQSHICQNLILLSYIWQGVRFKPYIIMNIFDQLGW